jgi:phage shock protein A
MGFSMDETMRSIQAALVDAIAGEHRFRRAAMHERQESDRWRRRAEMAEQRELRELGAEAGARAERHGRSAALYVRRAGEMRVQVERLRDALAATQGHGRAPPRGGVGAADPFAALEVESELEQIRGAQSQSQAVHTAEGAEGARPEGG